MIFAALQKYFKKLYQYSQIKNIELYSGFAVIIHKINLLALKGIFGNYLLRLKTYDGSGQLTHPSIEYFRGDCYLAATPYPYNCDIYENPCIYIRKNNSFIPLKAVFPVCKPETASHYSDPCLFVFKDRLFLSYRRVDREKNKDALVFTSSLCGKHWENSKVLLEGNQNSLLSPEFLEMNNIIYMYSVRLEENTSVVEMRTGDNVDSLIQPEEVYLERLADDSFVWHISAFSANKQMHLLVLFKQRNGGYNKNLYYYVSEDGRNWVFSQTISFPPNISKEIKNLYKCAYDIKRRILVFSVRDMFDRWFLLEFPLELMNDI